MLVYQIQKNAQITVSVTCKSLATNGDGVRVKLLRNGQKIAPLGQRWQVVSGTSQFSYEQQFNVAKGEYIMLRVNRNFLNSYDNLDLDDKKNKLSDELLVIQELLRIIESKYNLTPNFKIKNYESGSTMNENEYLSFIYEDIFEIQKQLILITDKINN